MGHESTGEPRPLSDVEPEAAALRSQLDIAEVGSGCPCGCGTIDFVLPSNVPAGSRREGAGVLVEGDVLDDGGHAIGGLLLFLDDGRLSCLEVWSATDPLPLPPVAGTRLRAVIE